MATGRRLKVRPDELGRSGLDREIEELRQEFHIRDRFPPGVIRAAERATPADLPRRDLRAIPFVTIDPPGSRDLDQALAIEPRARGHVVHYAIADVSSFVPRASTIEREAFRRGVTVYAPDRRSPLYPAALSEDRASLLAGVDRPAVVFTHELDDAGRTVGGSIERAWVRSRRQLSYAEAQEDPTFAALRIVGERRQALARERGAVQIDLPEQEVAARDARHYQLELERRLPIEDWNAEISIMTGIVAAERMVAAGIGLLRVTDAPDPERMATAHTAARLLGRDFAPNASIRELVERLRWSEPRDAALLLLIRRAMGRARYVDLATRPPAAVARHEALQTFYAHCTAPMRRLADRYVLDLLVDLAAGRRFRSAAVFGKLPTVMASAESTAGRFERAVIDAAEALLLSGRAGERIPAVVLDVTDTDVDLQLADPPIRARAARDGRVLALGSTTTVVVAQADPDHRRVVLRLAD